MTSTTLSHMNTESEFKLSDLLRKEIENPAPWIWGTTILFTAFQLLTLI